MPQFLISNNYFQFPDLDCIVRMPKLSESKCLCAMEKWQAFKFRPKAWCGVESTFWPHSANVVDELA